MAGSRPETGAVAPSAPLSSRERAREILDLDEASAAHDDIDGCLLWLGFFGAAYDVIGDTSGGTFVNWHRQLDGRG